MYTKITGKSQNKIIYDNFCFNACGDRRTPNLLHKFIIKKRRKKNDGINFEKGCGSSFLSIDTPPL